MVARCEARETITAWPYVKRCPLDAVVIVDVRFEAAETAERLRLCDLHYAQAHAAGLLEGDK